MLHTLVRVRMLCMCLKLRMYICISVPMVIFELVFLDCFVVYGRFLFYAYVSEGRMAFVQELTQYMAKETLLGGYVAILMKKLVGRDDYEYKWNR